MSAVEVFLLRLCICLIIGNIFYADLTLAAQKSSMAKRVNDLKLEQLNPRNIFWGYEATFQNEQMVDEGRGEKPLPYKESLLAQLANSYHKMTAPKQKLISSGSLKGSLFEGYEYKFSSNEKAIVNMEPGCIEWTLTPKTIYQLSDAWAPVYAAAYATGLQPYILPTGRRAGGGQFHIGGTASAENPFIKNPLLLRNLMVFFHSNPGILFGFSEGFDVGPGTNAQTFHNLLQESFSEVIEEFDKWYLKAGKTQNAKSVVKYFIGLITDYGLNLNAYARANHYAAINLEHFIEYLETGKDIFTIELRNLRPMKSPEHIESVALMLLKLMDHLSKPNLLVPFKNISVSEFNSMYGGLAVEENWEEIKKLLNLKDPILDEMVLEYSRNPNLKVSKYKDYYLRASYSEASRLGQNFEIFKILKPDEKPEPFVLYKDQKVPLKEVTVSGQRLAVGMYAVDMKRENEKHVELIRSCKKLF